MRNASQATTEQAIGQPQKHTIDSGTPHSQSGANQGSSRLTYRVPKTNVFSKLQKVQNISHVIHVHHIHVDDQIGATLMSPFLCAAHEAENHGPNKTDAVVQRQAHPNWASVDQDIAWHPQSPDGQIVCDDVVPVFIHGILNHAERDASVFVALNQLLEGVKDWEVNECIMDEVIKRHLFHQVDLASTILKFFGPRCIRKADRVGAEFGEDSNIDEPLHSAKIEAAKGREDAQPVPVEFLLALRVLDHGISGSSLDGGYDDVCSIRAALREGKNLFAKTAVSNVLRDAVAARRPRGVEVPPPARHHRLAGFVAW